MEERTNLVAVTSSTALIIASKYKSKTKTFHLRDISKLRRADAWDGDSSDDSNYSYDEETHVLCRRVTPLPDIEEKTVRLPDDAFLSGDDEAPLSAEELYAQMQAANTSGASSKRTPRQRKMIKATEAAVYQKWCNSVTRLAKPPKALSKCQYVPEMEAAAARSIDLTMKGDTLPWPRTVIVGPKGSGKSTFLSVYLRTLSQRMASNGSCKLSKFVFFDLQNVNFESILSIYTFIVTQTITQMADQEPKLEPFAQKMAQYFSGIPSGKSPLSFPKRIPIDSVYPYVDIKLTKLSRQIKSLSDGDIPKFLSFMFKFPVEIGKIFDLKNIFYILDHFELSDEYIMSHSVADVLKTALCDVPFVISCRDERKMLSVLRSIGDDRANMNRIVTFLNLSDIRVKPPLLNYEFVVSFEHSHSVRLKRSHCGGCVAFLVEWGELVKLATDLSEWEQKYGKIKKGVLCDKHIKCVDKAQNLMKKILSQEYYPSERIMSVKLVKCMS